MQKEHLTAEEWHELSGFAQQVLLELARWALVRHRIRVFLGLQRKRRS